MGENEMEAFLDSIRTSNEVSIRDRHYVVQNCVAVTDNDVTKLIIQAVSADAFIEAAVTIIRKV